MTDNDIHIAITATAQIAYREAGHADLPVALFVHGVIVNSHLWRHQLAELSNVRRCIAVDLMGHGATEVADDADVSCEAQAEMPATFLDALGIDRVDLVANDSGTGIAQIFAVRHPHRVRSMVLTNGDVHHNWPPADFARFVEMVRDGGLRTTLEAMLTEPDNYQGPDGFGGDYADPSTVSDDTVKALHSNASHEP